MGGFYEHMGGSKMHMIAIIVDSVMWMNNPKYPSLIGEGRDGSLQPCSSEPESDVGWYQINRDIFTNDHKPKRFKVAKEIKDIAGTVIGYDYNYVVLVYPGKTLLFSLENTGKFLVPLVEDDPAEIIDFFKNQGLLNDSKVRELEKLFFQML